MESFFIEIVFNNENKMFSGTKYLRGLVMAKDVDEAKELALSNFKPHYTGGDKGRFYVQCAWKQKSPTLKTILAFRDNVFKATMPIAERGSDGSVLGYRHPSAFMEKTIKELKHLWSICNFTWGDVYYSPQHEGYVVTCNMYMCDDFIINVFKGKTNETYEQALKWVEDNTLKKTHFHKFIK